jgi:hypothetical protein
MLALQSTLEFRERRHAALLVFVDPAVVDQADRHWIQEVQLLPARPADDHEARVLQHAQVLHDPEARHLQLRLELLERAAVTREEPVEQEASRGVGEGLEHAIVVVRHAWKIGDRMVTCQADGRIGGSAAGASADRALSQASFPTASLAVRASTKRRASCRRREQVTISVFDLCPRPGARGCGGDLAHVRRGFRAVVIRSATHRHDRVTGSRENELTVPFSKRRATKLQLGY